MTAPSELKSLASFAEFKNKSTYLRTIIEYCPGGRRTA